MASAVSSVPWGGLWQTVCELPDSGDALPGLEHAVKGFAALEAARTLADVKTALFEWFGDKQTRDRFNSPILDQLYLLFTMPFRQNVYITATVLGFSHTLQFLLRLDDAPDKHGQRQILGWAVEHHQDAIVKYLSDQGVPRTLLVSSTPFQVKEHVYARTIERGHDVLYWIEPVNLGEQVTLSGNGNVLFVFSERLVFDVPFLEILLYLTHLSVSGPVRCGCGNLTELSRQKLCHYHKSRGFHYVHGGHQFALSRGVITPVDAEQIINAEPLSTLFTNELDIEDRTATRIAPLRVLAYPDITDEVVHEIKRLTGLSYVCLFGLDPLVLQTAP